MPPHRISQTTVVASTSSDQQLSDPQVLRVIALTMAPSAVPTSRTVALSKGFAHAEPPAQVQVIGKTKTGKDLKIRQYPKFESLEDERLYRKQHLAAAFRVFADRGFDEGVAGHISVRDPILTDHFCMPISVSYEFALYALTDLKGSTLCRPIFHRSRCLI